MDSDKIKSYYNKFYTCFLEKGNSADKFLLMQNKVMEFIELVIKNDKEYILTDPFIRSLMSSFESFIIEMLSVKNDFENGILTAYYNLLSNKMRPILFLGFYDYTVVQTINMFKSEVIDSIYAAYRYRIIISQMSRKNILDSGMKIIDSILIILLSKCIIDNKVYKYERILEVLEKKASKVVDDLRINGFFDEDGLFISDESLPGYINYSVIANRLITLLDNKKDESAIIR